MKGGIKMVKKINAVFVTAILVVSLFLAASVSAGQFQIRPMNTINHPGLSDPYVPIQEGPNHAGVSDYSNVWAGHSEICESDYQVRPANWQTRFLRWAIGCDTEN